MNPLLTRSFLALGLLLLGTGAYLLANRVILVRASKKNLGLEAFQPGKPAVLYFTMEGCVPCQTTQRPALEKLACMTGEQIQIIHVDVVQQPQLAESWGVLSVPTTFIIDPTGQPRHVNHGVTLAEKLLDQLEQAVGRPINRTPSGEQVEIRFSTIHTD